MGKCISFTSSSSNKHPNKLLSLQSLSHKKQFISKKMISAKSEKIQKTITFLIHLPNYHKNILATGDNEGDITLWDINTMRIHKIMKANIEGKAINVLFHPHVLNKNYLISGGEENSIRVWNMDTGLCERQIATTSAVLTLEHPYGLDCNMIISSIKEDYQLYIWKMGEDDTTPEKLAATLTGHLGEITCMLYLGKIDKKYVISGSDDTTIILWDLSSNKKLKTFDEHTSAVIAVTYVRDSLFASASKDTLIKIWDVDQLVSLRTINTGQGQLKSLINFYELTGQCFLLTNGNEKQLKVYNFENSAEEFSLDLESPIDKMHLIFESSKYAFVSYSKDGSLLKLWNIG